MIRYAIACGLALAIGLLAQSVLLAGVLAIANPATLRFLDFTLVLYLTPTAVVLLIGIPLLSLRKIRDRLGAVYSTLIGASLGALGASVPESYVCMNPLLRCFLDTPRDAAAGLGSIFSGVACGIIACLVNRRLTPMRQRSREPT